MSRGEDPGTTPEIFRSEGDNAGGGSDDALGDEDFDLLLISPTRATSKDSSLPLPPPGSLPAGTPRLSFPYPLLPRALVASHTELPSRAPARARGRVPGPA